MKRMLSVLLALCLLTGTLPWAQAWALQSGGLGEAFEAAKPGATGGLGDLFEQSGSTAQPGQLPAQEPTPNPASVPSQPPTAMPAPGPTPPLPALFDEGVRDITCAPYGNRVDYAQIGGWTISRGYLYDQGIYCLVGQTPDGRVQALTDGMPSLIVPSGDAFIYYGPDAEGKLDWVIRKPGEAPKNLGLRPFDEVLYADGMYIWYFNIAEDEVFLRRLSRKDNEMKEFGRTTSLPLTLQEDGGIVVFDQTKNRVESWKDGNATTLYETEDLIFSVASIGKNIWVEQEHEFGLLEDGKLPWRLPGNIVQMVGTTDQFVFLLSFPGSDEYDMILFNEKYRAYVQVGYVPASKDAFVQLHPDRQLTVWSPVQSIVFDVPPADQWIPYGYYDVESAWAAMQKEGMGK